MRRTREFPNVDLCLSRGNGEQHQYNLPYQEYQARQAQSNLSARNHRFAPFACLLLEA